MYIIEWYNLQYIYIEQSSCQWTFKAQCTAVSICLEQTWTTTRTTPPQSVHMPQRLSSGQSSGHEPHSEAVTSPDGAPTDTRAHREPLHAVLPCDGVAVLRVVEERHVDSDQRRPVSCQDLTPDDWRQAVQDKQTREGFSEQAAATASAQPSAVMSLPAARGSADDLLTIRNTHTSGTVTHENAPHKAARRVCLLLLKTHHSPAEELRLMFWSILLIYCSIYDPTEHRHMLNIKNVSFWQNPSCRLWMRPCIMWGHHQGQKCKREKSHTRHMHFILTVYRIYSYSLKVKSFFWCFRLYQLQCISTMETFH